MKYMIIFCLAAMFTLPSFAQLRAQQECVVEKGVLKTINMDYNTSTGDRTILVNGIRKNFYDVYPETGPDYAAGQAWYTGNEAVPFNKRSYVKYGLPRVLGTTEIIKSGVYKGVGVYVEAGLKGPVEVIYIPVRGGCEFQPYQSSGGSVKIEKVNVTATTTEFKAIVTGISGTPTYNWISGKAPIIKGQGTSTIIVNTKNKKDTEPFKIELLVNEKTSSPVITKGTFTVSGRN